MEALDQNFGALFTDFTVQSPLLDPWTRDMDRILASLGTISSDTPGTVPLLSTDVSAQPAGTVSLLLDRRWTRAVTSSIRTRQKWTLGSVIIYIHV